jgi:hypothetical protein
MARQKSEEPDKSSRKPAWFSWQTGIGIVIILIGLSGIFYFASNWAALAANMANPLRSLIGNQGVARLETFLFNLQDQFHQWEFNTGRKQAAAPWQVAEMETPPAVLSTPGPFPLETKELLESRSPIEAKITPTITPGELKPLHTQTPPGPTKTQETPPIDDRTSTPEKSLKEWLPEPVPPFGTVEGEGMWEPYIHDSEGRTVAARTFLRPDQTRPFAYVAVVAFDLTAVDLNFVIGFDEPSEKGGPKGKGVIPPDDFQEDLLLAAFNGGFQSTHGGYGAMENGFVPLPVVGEAATVAIYQDGRVRIGEWGSDLDVTSDMVAYRQNCAMIVHNGEISPTVYNNSTSDWGGTIDNQIVTWRSGLGISEDGQILYYFVGPSLSMPVLADAMLAAGAYQSMLLDINAFWVHFVAIRNEDGALISEPLLTDDMKHNVDRFLKPFPRDFFYITSKGQD